MMGNEGISVADALALRNSGGNGGDEDEYHRCCRMDQVHGKA